MTFSTAYTVPAVSADLINWEHPLVAKVQELTSNLRNNVDPAKALHGLCELDCPGWLFLECGTFEALYPYAMGGEHEMLATAVLITLREEYDLQAWTARKAEEDKEEKQSMCYACCGFFPERTSTPIFGCPSPTDHKRNCDFAPEDED